MSLAEIHYVEHAADVLGCALEAFGKGQDIVLITSIDIRGGAAREVGSLAVVTDDGSMYGYMSNGCIDRDIQFRASQLLNDKKGACVVRYGEGSQAFDLKLPCGGSLELLFDPDPSKETIKRAHDTLVDRKEVDIVFDVPDRDTGVAFRYEPKPRLALAGRGAIFRATAQVATSAGFEVLLFSPETEDLEALAEVESLQSLHLTNPNSTVDMELDRFSGFLTLFHDHDWETELLKSAVKTEARFIGCLGSRRTHEMRLATLQLLGVDEAQLARLKGPIGLVPSLRQAPAIAVSAMAEIVEAFPNAIHEVTPKTGQ